jgi:hypothetical protein
LCSYDFFDDSGWEKMLGGLGAGGGEQPDHLRHRVKNAPTPFHWGNVPIAEGISPRSILTSTKSTSSSLDLDFGHHRLLSSGKVLLLHRRNASKFLYQLFLL